MDDKIINVQSLRDTADAQLADDTRSELEASNRKVKELTAAFAILKNKNGRDFACSSAVTSGRSGSGRCSRGPQHAQVN
jgi:hypothetical protein